MKKLIICAIVLLTAVLMAADVTHLDNVGVYTPAHATRANTFTADQTVSNAGGDSNSYKLLLQSHMTAGDETQTSSIYTAWGADPYMVLAAPSATGVETQVIHLDTVSLRCAADGLLNLGGTGAGRFHDVFISGTLDVEVEGIVAQTSITADTGDIVATAGLISAATTVTGGTGVTATTGNVTATAGDVVAGDDVFDVLGEVRMIYPVVSAADPAEPFDCTVTVLGWQIIVDDTDDGTNQVVCICLGVDDVINYEWQRADDNASICPSLP